ncbi:MAG: glycosyltransferase family 4 protein, partial [Gammaproteobacteria bacterium]|nr:glycosyltransferase family 4 protein [Gammaproteobacteria bacterium]
GSIHPRKGQKEFVEAAIHVLAERSDVCFFIVGVNDSARKSAYFREICDTIEAAGRQSDIRFIDWLPDINEILPQMTLTVVPSHGEAFGRVAAEAMAAGVGVIATEVAGLCEIVRDDHSGLLIPKGDSAALARAMMRLLSDVALRERIAQTAQETVRLEFGYDTVMARIEQAYRRAEAQQ